MAEDFDNEIKVAFLEEAWQLVLDTEECFLDLEKNNQDKALFDKIFRLAHSLKGSANAVGFADLGKVTHELETLILRLKEGKLAVTSHIVSVLLECNDHIKMMLQNLKLNMLKHIDCSHILRVIDGALHAEAPAASIPTEVKRAPTEVSEVTQVMSGPQEEIGIVAQKQPVKLVHSQVEDNIRVSVPKIEKLINFVGEMVILQTILKNQTLDDNLTSGSSNAVQYRKHFNQLLKITKEVQEMAMGLRMLPLKPSFQKLQRIVRDTSKALDKDIEFITSGDDTEIDKGILESLSDPLLHLVRNACDHGIEGKKERFDADKNLTGTIFMSAYHQSGRLVIEIKDDGGGLNAEKLKAKAIEKGIIPAHKELTLDECYMLIFAPGFSTKTEVTDISGRGVGMDVVKTNIEALQGEIKLTTELGKGTTFKISLPLTLAIIDGLVINQSEQHFIIPLSHVQETAKFQTESVTYHSGLGEMFKLRDQFIPLYRLENLIHRARKPETTSATVIILANADRLVGVAVDEVLNQQTVVIKKMGEELGHLKGFAGSAILGSGMPAIILELKDLIQKYGTSVKTKTSTARIAA